MAETRVETPRTETIPQPLDPTEELIAEAVRAYLQNLIGRVPTNEQVLLVLSLEAQALKQAGIDLLTPEQRLMFYLSFFMPNTGIPPQFRPAVQAFREGEHFAAAYQGMNGAVTAQLAAAGALASDEQALSLSNRAGVEREAARSIYRAMGDAGLVMDAPEEEFFPFVEQVLAPLLRRNAEFALAAQPDADPTNTLNQLAKTLVAEMQKAGGVKAYLKTRATREAALKDPFAAWVDTQDLSPAQKELLKTNEGRAELERRYFEATVGGGDPAVSGMSFQDWLLSKGAGQLFDVSQQLAKAAVGEPTPEARRRQFLTTAAAAGKYGATPQEDQDILVERAMARALQEYDRRLALGETPDFDKVAQAEVEKLPTPAELEQIIAEITSPTPPDVEAAVGPALQDLRERERAGAKKFLETGIGVPQEELQASERRFTEEELTEAEERLRASFAAATTFPEGEAATPAEVEARVRGSLYGQYVSPPEGRIPADIALTPSFRRGMATTSNRFLKELMQQQAAEEARRQTQVALEQRKARRQPRVRKIIT